MQLLTSLKKLEIGDCKELDLFNDECDDGTQWVTSLEELKISNLMALPWCIGNLTLLQSLKIDECPNLTSLPEWIGYLTSLRNLKNN